MDTVRLHLREHVDQIQSFAQGELERARELERDKVATTRSDKLKVVVDKVTDLEKALEASSHTGNLEWHCMLCEAQHQDELLVKYFPEMLETVEESVLAHRSTQADTSTGLDPNVTWSFSEIMYAAEAGVRMTAASGPALLSPTALRGWRGGWKPLRLHAWRVSATLADADLAPRFNLDRLAAQRVGAEPQVEAEADRITTGPTTFPRLLCTRVPGGANQRRRGGAARQLRLGT